MKTPSILRLGWVLVVALVVVAGVSAFPAPASAAGITLSKRQDQAGTTGQAGTTLSEQVTANGHRTRTFTWTINKVANPTTLDLVQGGSDTVTYTVTLTKDDGTVHTWIDGEVCITNGGSVPTENLMSTLKVTQPPSQGVILSTSLDTTAKPVLAAGESYCYPYRIDIPSANSNTYKVNADTTITNHSGHLGVPFGPNAAATTTIPTTETLVHNTVTVSDTLGGPLGEFSDDHTVTYTHQFDCSNAGDNPNTASITYDDDTAGPSASATVTVKCTASGGCTRTIGYWKNHPDAVTPLLPIWLGTEGGAKSVKVATSSQAVTIESIPTASNGIDKLYAQLLAAKLSIKNDADGSAVTSTIQAADNFLANTNSVDWASLSNAVKSQVNGWATTLDNYNNGITGPGHCP